MIKYLLKITKLISIMLLDPNNVLNHGYLDLYNLII